VTFSITLREVLMTDNLRPDHKFSGTATRRSLVRGAAWAVPVVAAAVAAPAVAASTATCPVINQADQWTLWEHYNAAPGQARFSTHPTPLPDGSPRTIIITSTENITPNNSNLYAEVRWTAQMDVVAGTTYTFTFLASAGYGNNNATQSRAAFSTFRIDGETQATFSTRSADFPGIQLPIGSWTEYSFNYTPTTTGTIPVMFSIILPDRKGTEVAQDDIRYELPRVACS
jgi:hypothetical protein